jgi:hypothetical protein
MGVSTVCYCTKNEGIPRQSATADFPHPTALASRRQLSTPPSRCSLSTSLIFCIASLDCAIPSPLFVKKGRRMAVYRGLRRFDRAGWSVPGRLMLDTNPACRTAFRSDGKIVRHATGTLSSITPECCPPSGRNRVRHGPDYAADHQARANSQRMAPKRRMRHNFVRDWQQFTEHCRSSPVRQDAAPRQHRAVRAPILKPMMFRAVDLDELTEILASSSWLLDRSTTCSSSLPKARIAHQTPQGLAANQKLWRSRSFSRANVGPKSA